MVATIRLARLEHDRDSILAFIDGSQRYEAEFEPDRRLDDDVAGEHFDLLSKTVRERDGRMFIAEMGGTAIGWAACYSSQNEVFVVEAERRYGYVAELFVAEQHRGLHIGRALLATCEQFFRDQGVRLVLIGALARNTRAVAAYQSSGYAPYSVELRKYL